jgi:hypothetical protein
VLAQTDIKTMKSSASVVAQPLAMRCLPPMIRIIK